MSVKPTSALAVPFLGVLAGLQLIDPIVANTALVKHCRRMLRLNFRHGF